MGWGMWHTRERRVIQTRFFGENVMEGSHLEDMVEMGG
jgi:hypothetical protein